MSALDDDDWPEDDDMISQAEDETVRSVAHQITDTLELFGMTPAVAAAKAGIDLLTMDAITLGMTDQFSIEQLRQIRDKINLAVS